MQNLHQLTQSARKQFDQVLEQALEPLAGLPERDRQIFALRLARQFQNLYDGLQPVYGHRQDFNAFLGRLAVKLAEGYRDRPDDLKLLDLERDLAPDWFQRETMNGYVFYVERFAGTLQGVREHLDYLGELGVTYVHLMKVLRAREGENDGGYAVQDYRDVEPHLGSIDDLEALCGTLRERGISACVDLVLNHCAKEHPWALAARRGDERYQAYFYMYPDRTMPDEYEKTLPEVFPDFAPGNFSYYPEIDKWVWTTFNEYQWDLNWSNPEVFLEIITIMLFLANKGVDVFRLDAVAFMWKRLGTNSQNQPEVHDLLQALRACSRISAPAVAHKAEAIVAPDDLIHYFGTGKRHGKVSNIAYHNTLMVQYWSALASRDTRLMTHVLQEFPRTPTTIAWGAYIRGHDDIGWAVTDEEAAAVGLDGYLHRTFLSDYYAGLFKGSHARGLVFQHNPQTGDRRISGTFASLAGLEQALDVRNETLVTLSIERILLGHALIMGFGGIPLLYMGDELGMLNDHTYPDKPETAVDNRWVHRPYMDWAKAERRKTPDTTESRIFSGLQNIIRARKRTPHLHAQYASRILDPANPHLFTYVRAHPLGNLLAIYNVTERTQHLPLDLPRAHGIHQPHDRLTDRPVSITDNTLTLEPYARLWLTQATTA